MRYKAGGRMEGKAEDRAEKAGRKMREREEGWERLQVLPRDGKKKSGDRGDE